MSNGNGNGTAAAARTDLTRGMIGIFTYEFRKTVLPGMVGRLDWIRRTTSAFSKLLHCSAAVVVQRAPYWYYINEADFSHGQFARDPYLGVENCGGGVPRFSNLFVPEMAEQKGICVQNINADALLVFDRDGAILETQLDPEKLGKLVFDREFQTIGSVMLVPIHVKPDATKRALVYLFSNETDHFQLPLAGYAAHLLAGAAAPSFKQLDR